MTERLKDDLPAQDLVRARRDYFEGLYREHDEPREYSRSAAEVLRHQAVVSVARSLKRGPFRRILDAGCSLGQLTASPGARSGTRRMPGGIPASLPAPHGG